MIEQTLQSFCESRYKWLIVTSVTLAFGCAVLGPLVDDHFEQRLNVRKLESDLANVKQLAETMDELKASVQVEVERLNQIEARTTKEENVPQLRNRIIEMARQAGCQVRKLQFGKVHTRPWNNDDNPLVLRPVKKPVGDETPFQIQHWPVTMAISGQMVNLRSMLSRMEAENMLVHTQSLELHPAGNGRKNVLLDLDLLYLTLIRG